MNISLVILVVLAGIFVGAGVAYLTYMSRHALDEIESYDDSPIEL